MDISISLKFFNIPDLVHSKSGKRKGCYDIPAVSRKVAVKIPKVKFFIGCR